MRKRLTRVGLLVAALLIVVGVAGYRVEHYVSREPAYCVSCHSVAAESARQHAHKSLACQDCHSASLAKGMQLLARRQLGLAATPAHGKPNQASCRACHTGAATARSIARTSGHVVHVLGKSAKAQLTCDKCHQLKGHQTKANQTACAQCHSELVMHESGMVRVTCLDCHDYKAAPTSKGSIPAIGCPKCHDGRALGPDDPKRALQSKYVVAPDVTHGNINACRLCHDPHRLDQDRRRRGTDCQACHKNTVTQMRASGAKGHTNCATCHQTHGPRPQVPTLCAGCHENMLATAAPAALSSRHHDCSTCHKPHTFKIAATDCSRCHAAQATQIAAWTQSRHSDCLTCHQGHSPSKAASSCNGCHQQMRQHGHAECVTCHEPHQSKSATKACVSCHGGQSQALAAQKVTAHANCLACHDQHNAGRATERCSRCHAVQTAAALRSEIDTHKRCASCHRPHQFTPSTTVCLNCHAAAKLGAHDGACTKCHQQHGPPASAALVCRNCHQNVPEVSGKHADCRSCHAPHQSTKGGPTCSACHAGQWSGTSQWQPAPHRDCQSCHQRHAPVPVKKCAECHAPMTALKLSKGHSCQGCHSPHQKPLGFGTCERCHAAEATAVRTQHGTHGACKSCHEPHGDRVPTCQSCHTTRPGSHATPGHEKCRSCHESHAAKAPIRARCLTCHTDKKNHYPAVAQCATCHLFGKESGAQ